MLKKTALLVQRGFPYIKSKVSVTLRGLKSPRAGNLNQHVIVTGGSDRRKNRDEVLHEMVTYQDVENIKQLFKNIRQTLSHIL